MGLCTLDGFMMTNQLSVMLPCGEEYVALDLTTETPASNQFWLWTFELFFFLSGYKVYVFITTVF
jgi:hypothetical protein